MKVLVIIPARKGSKRLKRKNIIKFVKRQSLAAPNDLGFIYYVTLRGVTGSSNLNSEEIIKNINIQQPCLLLAEVNVN